MITTSSAYIKQLTWHRLDKVIKLNLITTWELCEKALDYIVVSIRTLGVIFQMEPRWRPLFHPSEIWRKIPTEIFRGNKNYQQ